MEELIKALKSLISDIDGMRVGSTDNFGGFSEAVEDEGMTMIEWPNLAISVDDVKQILDEMEGPVVEGELVMGAGDALALVELPETTQEAYALGWNDARKARITHG